MSTVHFYTSCTLTKSAPVSTALSAKNLRAVSVAKRFAEWRSRLDAWEGQRCTALDLYSGGHWSVVRDLAAGLKVGTPEMRTYAISAGYGLITTGSAIAPYAATFAVGHEDSISCARGKIAPSENAQWWYELSTWHPAGIHGPRSIYEVFKASRENVHLFALSPSYLDAISDDLLVARAELSNPETLIVISTGEQRYGTLNSSVVSASAELQATVGGALSSLNVRLAARILTMVPVSRMTVGEIRVFVADAVRRAKPRNIPQRRNMSDSEVIHFIQKAQHPASNSSYTRMLKALRDAGNACEMKRFKSLFYRAISQHTNGSI